ncbi:MAG: FtsH protease activity modulator HflK, partial [Dehalococcoidia bacterium]|nr:FtsH protease activity modulator HflK [Dehalococcoidia bacterium]
MYQPPRREPEIDLEQFLNRIRTAFSGFGGRFGGGSIIPYLTFGILAVALFIWMASGKFTVGPGEKAALRTFGKCCKITEENAGLQWHWPSPIGTRNVESIRKVESMELGFSSAGDVSSQTLQQEAQMIAGDLNIVDVPLVVQYRIRDPEGFLFNVDDPGEQKPPGTRDVLSGRPEGRTLKDATEAALRLVVGQRPVDDVLTDKREEVQAATQELLQQILDDYNAGIQILEVRLQEVSPPQEVVDAFQDVNRARQDLETSINQAEAFERDIIPRARGEAERIIQAAEAFKQERINRAEGEAGRFLAILREFEKAKEVTRQRLYLEAMEEILPGITKFVVSPETEGAIILNAGRQIVPVPGISTTTTAQPLPSTP